METDSELIRRFRRGEAAAFETFVSRHQDRIFRLAAVYLRSKDEAADVAQEVFLRAFTGLGRFRFHAQPFTWLFRTLRNVCNEHNRRTKRDRGRLTELDESLLPVHESERLDSRHRLQQVRTLVERLPRRQRDVVLLRIFEGLSVDETATTLGCRPGTVKALLYKARRRLTLEGHDDTNPPTMEEPGYEQTA